MSRVLLVAFTASTAAQNLPLPPLSYAYDALEPHIDATTMEEHHSKHHRAYTNKLNAALETLRGDPATKALAKLGIDTLLQRLDQITDPKLRAAVRNAGGGFVNHELFFATMSPDGGGDVVEHAGLNAAIVSAFGTMAMLKRALSLSALEVFGSGWAWLALDRRSDKLVVQSTPNQDTPAMDASTVPLLGIDVWEHAYYLKHQSRRADYIKDWWHVVSWPEVARRYEAARAATGKAEL
mmetsp:Transcript_5950/g.19599  ORF Transcript_5950/g.19599 Transcript_5950/m.19599 type:complete len:238 (+) Transcript_5950:33-746(+)